MVVTSAKRPAILRAQIVNDAFVTFPQAASATAQEPCANVANNDVLHDDHHCVLDDAVDAEAPRTVVATAAALAPSSYAYPGFMHTIDQKWTANLLKVLDDINAPDYAFGLILSWARGASAEEYSFRPQGGLERSRNVEVLLNSIANAKQLLPVVQTVQGPHGPPSQVVVFDFVPQLLSLLQNRSLMIQENVVLDLQNPLVPYQSPGGLLGEALSGSVYQQAYARLITDPTRQLLVPIIQWIDRTSVTGNDRFSLKPYMFTLALFTAKFRRTIKAWGYHGFLPKSKTSSAQNQTQLPGENIRNYHAQLSRVLESFRHAVPRLRDVVLPIGPTGAMQVDIIPCILFVIQDMQEGDMLCGRYGPHTPQIQRHCRSCNVDYSGLAQPDVACKYLYAEPMHVIAQSENVALRQRWSQHYLDNAFRNVTMADPDRGIFGATPVETLHAVRKGLVEMITFVVLDNVPASKKAALDCLALRFHTSHRQTCRSTFPKTTFCNGITNITKISAAERLGLVFLFVILGHYHEGWTILSSALENSHTACTEPLTKRGRKMSTTTKTTASVQPLPKHPQYTPQFKDILQVFEMLLCFDAWLSKETYWAHKDTSFSKAIVSRSICTMMKLCKKYIPTKKPTAWNYPKFHELLHVVDDMIRFGSPLNFCAQRPESLLIVAAKQPGRRSQKRHKGVSYELQAAQRLCYSMMIDTVNSRIQNGAPSLHRAPTGSETPMDTPLHESTKGATNAILTCCVAEANNTAPSFEIHWDSKTDVHLMQVDIQLLRYLHTTFGTPVHFCTQYKRDIYTFRCHPSFGSTGPLYDWMVIKFDTGLFPCRLAAVVFSNADAEEPLQLVVQSTTTRTKVKSVLFQEWSWSPEYITVSPKCIEAPCFVISIRDDHSLILETLAREKWAEQFTHVE